MEAAFAQRGATPDIRATTPSVSATQLAKAAVKEGVTHLVVCGGDGTVMGAVNGLGCEDTVVRRDQPAEAQTRPQVTLSIIPAGTANLLATALHIPVDVEKAVETAMTGVDKEIDLGWCGDHLFALGLGLGLTEKLVSQASAVQKERLGKLAYAIAMLRELGARPHQFTFRLDGGSSQRARGVAVVVANAGEIGGGVCFAPDARMDDDRLDLCILHRFHWHDLLRMAWRALRRQLPQDRAVSFYQARRIEIGSQPPLDLQIDGEPVDEQTPLAATVIPRALRVRVPRGDDRQNKT